MSLYAIKEQQSAVIKFDLVDENGDPVPASSLQSATLSVYDVASDERLNDRDEQDVLNDNDVTIDEDGHVIWAVQPDDNAVVNEAVGFELHHAVFDFVWASGAKRTWERIDLKVTTEKVIS